MINKNQKRSLSTQKKAKTKTSLSVFGEGYHTHLHRVQRYEELLLIYDIRCFLCCRHYMFFSAFFNIFSIYFNYWFSYFTEWSRLFIQKFLLLLVKSFFKFSCKNKHKWNEWMILFHARAKCTLQTRGRWNW